LEDCVGAAPTKDSTAQATGSARTNPDFISPQLAAAMSHPTRVHTMSLLLERTASPRQIADAIGERLNNVTYHLSQLLKLGCIELVRTERVRGGRVVEHFYRATQRLYFDEAAWQALGEKERLDLAGVTLRMISQDIANSMAAGTFFSDDAHICRAPMVVDPDGWQEITELLERTTEELFEIEARVAERTADGAPTDVHTRVGLMQFRSPPLAADEPLSEA
jgi:DNA-binding transcriptional ArsR family regulator